MSLDEQDEIKKTYCTKCQQYKPPRTHHCSKMERCVLCMDHYCTWLGVTIGFYNRKSFILLIVYGNFNVLLYLFVNFFDFLEVCTSGLMNFKKG